MNPQADLKAIKAALGWSDNQIARSLRVDAQTVTRIRTGATTTRLETANKIQALRVAATKFQNEVGAIGA